MQRFLRATSRDWMGLIGPRLGQGWAPYLLSFMFRQMPGSRVSVQAQQRRVVEGVYTKLACQAVRRPCASHAVDYLPILIAIPDFPVFKREKTSVREITINEGQHVHGMLLWPPESRLKTDVMSHIEQNEQVYLSPDGCLSRLHCRPITHDFDYVHGYVTKSLTRGRVDHDALIILPRTRSELRDVSAPVGRNSSIFGSKSR